MWRRLRRFWRTLRLKGLFFLGRAYPAEGRLWFSLDPRLSRVSRSENRLFRLFRRRVHSWRGVPFGVLGRSGSAESFLVGSWLADFIGATALLFCRCGGFVGFLRGLVAERYSDASIFCRVLARVFQCSLEHSQHRPSGGLLLVFLRRMAQAIRSIFCLVFREVLLTTAASCPPRARGARPARGQSNTVPRATAG